MPDSVVVVSHQGGHWGDSPKKSCWKIKWDKVFKNGRSKICGWQPLKSLKGYECNIKQ